MNRYRPRTALLEGFMILAGVAFMVPVYLLVNLSIRHPQDQSSPFAPTAQPTLVNYQVAWEAGGLALAFLTSIVVTVVSTGLVLATAALAAYPLARHTSRLSSWTYFFFLFGLLLPFQLAMVPLYTTMRDLGLLGNPLSLILYYWGSQLPFAIFMYAGFLRVIPPDYEEAAAIDGAGPLATFWGVIFPLLRPVTGTIAILTVIAIWNDYLIPMLYLSGSRFTTLPVAITSFVGQYAAQWNVVFAGLVLSVSRVLIAYFVLQKTIIHGVAGGLKG